MATYITSDIHGMYDKFQDLLKLIKFKPTDYLLILGDNIDRGPDSAKVLAYIKNNPNIESLIGNHELMMLNEIFSLGYSKSIVGDWSNNGSKQTMRNLAEYASEHGEESTLELLDECNNWSYYKHLTVNNRDFLCIHAGYWMVSPTRYKDHYNADPENLLSDTTDVDKVWLREEFYLRRGIPNITTIFGHTPTMNLHGEFTIWYDPVYGDKINIDCGAAYGGKLACLRLDDMQEFYV